MEMTRLWGDFLADFLEIRDDGEGDEPTILSAAFNFLLSVRIFFFWLWVF